MKAFGRITVSTGLITEPVPGRELLGDRGVPSDSVDELASTLLLVNDGRILRYRGGSLAGWSQALFEAHGIHFDPTLRDQVVARVEKLNLPSYSGFVMPKLTPVRSADGQITDVLITYPMDLTAQMLEYSGVRR